MLLVHEQRFEPDQTRKTRVEQLRESHCNSDNLPMFSLSPYFKTIANPLSVYSQRHQI